VFLASSESELYAVKEWSQDELGKELLQEFVTEGVRPLTLGCLLVVCCLFVCLFVVIVIVVN